MIEVTSNTWDVEVLQSNIPVLVDFSAPWCGPCKRLEPLLEELEVELSGKVKIVKLDIDASPEVARDLGVMSVPTLFVFDGGTLSENRVGLAPKQFILDMLKPYIRAF